MLPRLLLLNYSKKDQSRIAHTLISTGAYLNWGLDNVFLGFDVTNHTVTLFDEGKNLFSGTTVPHITKAVVAAIRHPELTLNKRIFIADVSFTQQQASVLFEKYTDAKWTVNNLSTKEELKNAEESLKKVDLQNGIRPYVMAVVYNGEGACNFEGKTSNEALGLETFPLEQIVKEAVQQNIAVH